jgi:RHS repeat-associated protein
MVSNIYYYQDELGSTSHVANASGALLEYYKYDLYGKPTYWSTANSQLASSNYNVRDLGDGGARWIVELGLYDDRNRFMSPDLGRFIQPDPIGFKGDASNIYRYCGNDWANKTDPTGLGVGTAEVGGSDPADSGNFGELSTDTKLGAASGQVKQQQQAERGSILGPMSGRITTQQFRNPQENMMGFTMGQTSKGFHDPVIDGKNYVGSSDYQSLGKKAANEARELAYDSRKEYLGGISEKKDGSKDFIIIPPIPQFKGTPNAMFHHKMGPKNFSYIDRPDPSPTGYRLVADVVGHVIFAPRISKEDMQSFHFMGHDAFVGVPSEPGTSNGPQVYFYDHNIEPPH